MVGGTQNNALVPTLANKHLIACIPIQDLFAGVQFASLGDFDLFKRLSQPCPLLSALS